MMRYLYLCLFLMVSPSIVALSSVENVLDTFHQAAADANAKLYLAQLHHDGVFIGTDGHERWDKDAFQQFVEPYFAKGQGWRYTSVTRNVSYTSNHQIAFFDEILDNQYYGRCRGSGVMMKTPQGWQILQYNLSVVVPNGVTKKVVEVISTFHTQKDK